MDYLSMGASLLPSVPLLPVAGPRLVPRIRVAVPPRCLRRLQGGPPPGLENVPQIPLKVRRSLRRLALIPMNVIPRPAAPPPPAASPSPAAPPAAPPATQVAPLLYWFCNTAVTLWYGSTLILQLRVIQHVSSCWEYGGGWPRYKQGLPAVRPQVAPHVAERGAGGVAAAPHAPLALHGHVAVAVLQAGHGQSVRS